MHGPVNKYELNLLYYISNFSRLSQAVYRGLINRLSHKVSYASMTIDPVMNEFSPNEVRSHLQIFDHSIINFGKYDYV